MSDVTIAEIRDAVARIERSREDDELVVFCHVDDFDRLEAAAVQLRAEGYRMAVRTNVLCWPGECFAIRAAALRSTLPVDAWFEFE
jgi:hypothetical protein